MSPLQVGVIRETRRSPPSFIMQPQPLPCSHQAPPLLKKETTSSNLAASALQLRKQRVLPAADERTRTHIAPAPADADTQLLLQLGSVPLNQRGLDVILVDFPDFFPLLFRDGIRCFLAGFSRRLRELRVRSPGWRSRCSETQQETAWVSEGGLGLCSPGRAVGKRPF